MTVSVTLTVTLTLTVSAPSVPDFVSGRYSQCTAMTRPFPSFWQPMHLTT